MAVTLTYPSVYIEELTDTVRSIGGVRTSITAFIGRTLKGSINDPVLIHNFGEFKCIFGGLWANSSLSYAVYQFFLNGGHNALIVRVQNSATKSIFDIDGAFVIEAANEGAWSRNLEIQVEPIDRKSSVSRDAINAELALVPVDIFTLFDLSILERIRPDSELVMLETHKLLSTKSLSSRFVDKVLAEESDLIRIQNSRIVLTIQPESASQPTSQPDKSGSTTYKATTLGDDGIQLKDEDICNPDKPKSGIFALDKADLFNVLCIPQYTESDVSPEVYLSALTYCEKRRAMLIVDPPSIWKSAQDPMNNITGIDGINGFGRLRHKNAAIFFPRLKATDPEMGHRMREFVPCGAVAGVIARTDADRGVWKSPAGTEATLNGVSDLTVKLTDAESADLNSLGINCLRIIPTAGIVVWGARTMSGVDGLADEWKYIAVRRIALYIEESLYRGTKWAAFEPNDEPLWAQIRLNIGAFMHDLFRKGAFQERTPQEAYFVKCDSETTTQKDIDRGIVNIVVGFAPLKPAEFVIIKIQQAVRKSREG